MKRASSLDHECLVYLPLSYARRGPAESCVRIVEAFAAVGLLPVLYLPRTRAPIARSIETVETLPPLLRRLPWRYAASSALTSLDRAFADAIRSSSPERTLLYFWPAPPKELLEAGRRRGFILVREMINTTCLLSRRILTKAYQDLGVTPRISITDRQVAEEIDELHMYDFIFASNSGVEQSLLEIGIPSERIIPTSFGWSRARFGNSEPAQSDHSVMFQAAFVGTLGVRKGVPELIAAWEAAQLGGKLVLAGAIDPADADIIRPLINDESIEYRGQVHDLGALYRESDVFVFPSLEEGGPQVTYEAAACGLPSIVTPMGAARIITDSVTGIVVPAGAPQDIAVALRALAGDAELRTGLGRAAAHAAARYEYRHVGEHRATHLLNLYDSATTQ